MCGSFRWNTHRDGVYGTSITAFTTSSDAEFASRALDTQVFSGDYDTNVKLTNGCTLVNDRCSVVTPYGFSSLFLSQIFINNQGTSSDVVAEGFWAPGSGSGGAGAGRRQTIALWSASKQVSTVPEPENFTMMFAGLGLLGFVASRRQQKAAI